MEAQSGLKQQAVATAGLNECDLVAIFGHIADTKNPAQGRVVG